MAARARRTPLMTGSLEEKAMLVRLSQSKWSARKQSKIANAKVEELFRTAKGVTQVTKALAAHTALKEINSELDYAYNWHRAHTLPWSDDNYRILPSLMYTDYMTVMRKCTEIINEKAKIVEQNFEAIKQEAEIAMGGHIDKGGLYDPNDYPTDIKSRYANKVVVMPIPNKADFRVTHLSDEDIEAIEAQIAQQYESAEKEAMKDLYDQVKKVMTLVYEAFNDPNADFRDSKIENVTMLMETLPKLNLAGDENLDRMRRVIETKICTLNPKELRSDINARKNAAEDARKILAQMESYC